MQFGKAVTWIAIVSILFSAIGAVVGYLIGSNLPGYYRSVFWDGGSDHFDPVAVGFGQGLTQGLVLGATIGLILVLASWWKEARLATLAIEERHELQVKSVSSDESELHLRS